MVKAKKTAKIIEEYYGYMGMNRIVIEPDKLWVPVEELDRIKKKIRSLANEHMKHYENEHEEQSQGIALGLEEALKIIKQISEQPDT